MARSTPRGSSSVSTATASTATESTAPARTALARTAVPGTAARKQQARHAAPVSPVPIAAPSPSVALPSVPLPSGPSPAASTVRDRKVPSSRTPISSRAPSAGAMADVVPAGSNFVLLRGLIRRSPEFRVLPSGDELLSFDLTIRDGGQPAESVPVVWRNPPSAAVRFSEDQDVVVIGRVRRRFFRVAGSTASRTEVHADKILSSRSTARIRTAVVPRVEDLNL